MHKDPGRDPEPPTSPAGRCISALVTVSPSVILFTVAGRGHYFPPSPPKLANPGRRELRIRLGLVRTGVIFELGEGGRDHKTERRGPTLNLGTDSSSSLVLVQIPTTRGSSTISTGRLLDICGQG